MTKIQRIILNHYENLYGSKMALNIVCDYKNNFKIFLGVVEKKLESIKSSEDHE